MTRKELMRVKKVLENIKPKEDGIRYGNVLLAIALIDKEIAVREAQRDNFKDNYDYDEHSW